MGYGFDCEDIGGYMADRDFYDEEDFYERGDLIYQELDEDDEDYI